MEQEDFEFSRDMSQDKGSVFCPGPESWKGLRTFREKSPRDSD